MKRSIFLTILYLVLCSLISDSHAQTGNSVLGDQEYFVQHSDDHVAKGISSTRDNHGYTVYVFLLENCIISQYYTKVLNELYDHYQESGVEFIGLFPNKVSTATMIDSFALRYKITFPLFLDHEKEFVNHFDATITPEVFVYEEANDKLMYRGRIDDSYFKIGRKRPKAKSHDLQNALESIVNNEAVEVKSTTAVGCIINMTN